MVEERLTLNQMSLRESNKNDEKTLRRLGKIITSLVWKITEQGNNSEGRSLNTKQGQCKSI